MADSQRKTASLFDGVIEQGTITGQGIDSPATNRIRTAGYTSLTAGIYTLSFTTADTSVVFIFKYDNNDNFIERIPNDWASIPYTFTLDTACKIRFAIKHPTETTISPQDVSDIMLNVGSTALPYWQHSLRKLTTATEAVENPLYSDGTAITSYTIKGNTVQDGTPTPSAPISVSGVGNLETSGEHRGEYKIPVLSNSTTTPVYLGEVESTRRIRKWVLTGEEMWQISDTWKGNNTSVFYFIQYDTISSISNPNTQYMYSDRFVGVSRNALNSGDTDMVAITGTNSITIRISDAIATQIQSLKTWLATQYAAGTPVTLWYVLETPETATVNEPLMKIGDYADTLSNAASIPTTEGANSITVDTTVQPSEFTATWTGWHDATVKEWDSSQWNE